MRMWETTPPPAQALRRIALWLGVESAVKKESRKAHGKGVEQAIAAGIPVSGVLPEDPELALIDAPLGAKLTDL